MFQQTKYELCLYEDTIFKRALRADILIGKVY